MTFGWLHELYSPWLLGNTEVHFSFIFIMKSFMVENAHLWYIGMGS